VIECVSNISEGIRREPIAGIVEAVARAGCRVLDVHSDVDHNRTVLTFVGEAAYVERGAIALIRVAIDCLDLTVHQGVHPRFGVVDVVPFVPLHGSTMEECVCLARCLGETVADRFSLPVFLYGVAATRPERANLANVRRGRIEEVAERLHTADGRADFGPPTLHPTAGAVAIGARGFLVAYNVLLESRDVPAARSIAAAVRESGGGLPGVKALGLFLESQRCTQVSMNLTDVCATPIRAAFDQVAYEAAQRGIDIRESEIVGLVPEVSLINCRAADIRFPGDLESRILERRFR